jgi:carboxymethylenebutenolidase
MSDYSVIPKGAQRGAVVLHELFGMQPEIQRVVDRFAKNGYAAIAPDLFGSGSRVACLARAMGQMNRGEGPMIDQVRAARAQLCAESGLDERRVGLIGFCFGGGFALAAGRGWGAVSTNYGVMPPDEVMRGLGPTIGCYGRNDRIFGNMAPKLERKLRSLDIEVETHTFEGVGHSFLTDGHHPVAAVMSRPLFQLRYDPETAEEGWKRILAFFDKHL